MEENGAKQKGLQPLAYVVAWAQAGVDPSIMGTGPIPAVRAAVSFMYKVFFFNFSAFMIVMASVIYTTWMIRFYDFIKFTAQ